MVPKCSYYTGYTVVYNRVATHALVTVVGYLTILVDVEFTQTTYLKQSLV